MFCFLTRLRDINLEDVKKCADKLVGFYPADLKVTLASELEQFIPGLKSEHKEKQKGPIVITLKWMVDSDISLIFPNVYIAFRMFLTIPIMNCEAKRFFSTLARIKSEYHSTMTDKSLSGLSVMSILKDLLNSLSFDDVIKEFANGKARKKFLK